MNPRQFGWVAIGLGLAVAITAAIGPLWLDLIEFRLDASAVNQFVGGEVVSLCVVAPGLIVPGILWLNRHPLSPALMMGLALYTAYTYTTAALGQEYGRYEGNVEYAFLLFTNLVLGGLVLTIAGWMRFGDLPASTRSYPAQRVLAWIFIVLGLFFAFTWSAQLREVYADDPPQAYVTGPQLFWLIKFLDFAICIPALIATGIGLRRKSPLARKVSFALAVFGSCLIAAVFAMAIAMHVKDDPDASVIMSVATGGALLLLLVLTTRLLAQFSTMTGHEEYTPSE